MDKTAQQDEFITTPIGSEPIVKGVWDKYFSGPHKNIIINLRAAIKKNPELQMVLIQKFPGFSWAEFADMPGSNSFQQIKTTLDTLLGVPAIASGADQVKSSIEIYMAVYNLMLSKLEAQKKQPPKPPVPDVPQEGRKERASPRKKPIPSNKVKQLQKNLGVEETGLWNEKSNAAFLGWLRGKGWDKHIQNNRFTGNINDALAAMKVEETPEKQLDLNDLEQRQGARLEALKKLADK